MRTLIVMMVLAIALPLNAGERVVRINTKLTYFINLDVHYQGKIHTARSCRLLEGNWDTDPDPMIFTLDMKCPKGIFELRDCMVLRDVFELEVRRGVGNPNPVQCETIRRR